ncbi:hypothetical protein Ngar_c04820 [Candidatus Nitrososphaera gargensis Ga9.2]|uniref:Uncharacterized protein n=2 Tax=Candidatus Nitrososphaera gargensis TaxID=497727 RepID=K0I826_NITGG|nr:hypothetical protein Ngar_c04820 [Candidatus Nitrososphaera gargensis Ga9.2]
MMIPAMEEASRVAEVVDSLHDLIESKQVGADIAIVSLVSAAGEVALSLIVAQPELKEAYLKVFNSAVEQVRRQLRHEIKARKI